MLGEKPLYNFFSEYLSRILADNTDWEQDKSGFLTQLPCFGTAEEIALKLVELTATLPWPFTVTYVLPESLNRLLPNGTDQYVLSTSSRLIRVTEGLQTEFPLTSDDKRIKKRESFLASLLTGPDKQSLPLRRLLFQTQVAGYVGIYGKSEALRLAETRLKAFIGFLLAQRTLAVGFHYVPSPPKYETIVYEKHAGSWEITRKDKVEDDLGRLLSKLEVNHVDGKIADDQIEGWMSYGLTRIRSGFSDKKASSRLQLSAKWLVESYSNSRDLLGFVQAMVCLEIILGDQDDTRELGIGATIRNRCAFLIGNSHEEREEIAEQLKGIYRVRSKIVHTGKDQLVHDDYVMLFLLRDYCARVLARELEIAAEK